MDDADRASTATLWALGAAGVDVPLTLKSRDVTFDVTLKSVDRAKMMRAPKLH